MLHSTRFGATLSVPLKSVSGDYSNGKLTFMLFRGHLPSATELPIAAEATFQEFVGLMKKSNRMEFESVLYKSLLLEEDRNSPDVQAFLFKLAKEAIRFDKEEIVRRESKRN